MARKLQDELDEDYEDLSEEEAMMLREELLDADIANGMARLIMSHPKMQDTISGSGGHPGNLGMLAAQTLLGVRDKFLEKGMPHSPRIWTAENGVLRGIIDDLGDYASVSGGEMTPEVKEAAYTQAIKVLMKYDEAGAASRQGGGQQQGQQAPQEPPRAGPTGPIGGGMMGGGKV